MPKRTLVCIGLAAMMALTGCSMINDGVSDLGSDVSDITSDLSSGMSETESKVSSGISDAGSSMQSDRSDQDTDKDNSSLPHEDSSRTESAPVSGAPSEEAVSKPAVLPVKQNDLSSLDTKKQGWGQGVRVDEKNRPEAAEIYQERYGKYDAHFIGEDKPVIYLTFDCGYENGNTPLILDTLKEKNVKAIFFVVSDYVKRQPELVQRMIDEGHIIGNHSNTHPSMPEQSIERCEEEIMTLHNKMLEDYNCRMTLFRPPAGEFSDRTLAQTQNLGYQSVFWSYAYADWNPDKQMGPEKALPKITKALHPGAIYLLHAVSPDNAAILGDFIDAARKQGYTFEVFQ